MPKLGCSLTLSTPCHHNAVLMHVECEASCAANPSTGLTWQRLVAQPSHDQSGLLLPCMGVQECCAMVDCRLTAVLPFTCLPKFTIILRSTSLHPSYLIFSFLDQQTIHIFRPCYPQSISLCMNARSCSRAGQFARHACTSS